MLTRELPLGRFGSAVAESQVDARLDDVIHRTGKRTGARQYQHVSEREGRSGTADPADGNIVSGHGEDRPDRTVSHRCPTKGSHSRQLPGTKSLKIEFEEWEYLFISGGYFALLGFITLFYCIHQAFCRLGRSPYIGLSILFLPVFLQGVIVCLAWEHGQCRRSWTCGAEQLPGDAAAVARAGDWVPFGNLVLVDVTKTGREGGFFLQGKNRHRPSSITGDWFSRLGGAGGGSCCSRGSHG